MYIYILVLLSFYVFTYVADFCGSVFVFVVGYGAPGYRPYPSPSPPLNLYPQPSPTRSPAWLGPQPHDTSAHTVHHHLLPQGRGPARLRKDQNRLGQSRHRDSVANMLDILGWWGGRVRQGVNG